MRRRRTLAAVVGLLWLAACTPDGDTGPEVAGATVPTAAPTTTTTNPYAVPQVIDAAYVNRVLAGLDRVFGDAYRLVVSSKTVSPEALDRFKAVYGDLDLLNLALRVVQEEVRFGGTQIPTNPGNKKTAVSRLITSQPSCIYASVARNYSEQVRRATPDREEWIALRPLTVSSDPKEYNPTGWAYIYEGSTADSQAPRTPPCVG